MAQSDAQQAGDERRRTALRHGSRSPRLSCKGRSSADESRNANGRHMPTCDSCLVTLTGLVLRVLPRHPRTTRAHTGNVCVLGILLAGSPSLSGLSCQQIQQARISTGVARQTDAESPHFASPPCRKRSGAGRVCVALGGACGHECGLKQRTYRSGWPRVGSLRHRPRRRHRNRSAPLSRCHLWRRSQRCSPSSLQCILDRWWVRAATLYLLRVR